MNENTQQEQHPTTRPCPQNCLKCTPMQQIYCCTKMMFDQSATIQKMATKIESLETEIVNLKNESLLNKTDSFSEPMK